MPARVMKFWALATARVAARLPSQAITTELFVPDISPALRSTGRPDSNRAISRIPRSANLSVGRDSSVRSAARFSRDRNRSVGCGQIECISGRFGNLASLALRLADHGVEHFRRKAIVVEVHLP